MSVHYKPPSNDRQRSRECGKKTRYISQNSADRAAADYADRFGHPVNSYHCRWCDQFHIGHGRQLRK